MAEEYFPREHAEHRSAVPAVDAVPGGHRMHDAAPFDENDPARHGVQFVDDAITAAYLPDVQSLQLSALATRSLYLPTAQGRHSDMLAAAVVAVVYVPGGQAPMVRLDFQ